MDLEEHLARIRAIKTEKRAQAARENGKRPVKPGSRPRGRPRKTVAVDTETEGSDWLMHGSPAQILVIETPTAPSSPLTSDRRKPNDYT